MSTVKRLDYFVYLTTLTNGSRGWLWQQENYSCHQTCVVPGTWGLLQSDKKKLNSFHRKQLSWVIGIKWPCRITNHKLYQVTETASINSNSWKKMETARAYTKTASRLPRKERYNILLWGKHQQKVYWKKKSYYCHHNWQRQRNKRKTHIVSSYTTNIPCKSPKHSHKAKKELWQKVVSQIADLAYSL